MLKTRLEKGINLPKEDKDDFIHYRDLVDYYTKFSWNDYYNYINPKRLKRGKYKYHLDHNYSVFEGFKNNIPVWIICHPCNLQMLWCSDNISKSSKVHHTLEELIDKINTFNKENNYKCKEAEWKSYMKI